MPNYEILMSYKFRLLKVRIHIYLLEKYIAYAQQLQQINPMIPNCWTIINGCNDFSCVVKLPYRRMVMFAQQFGISRPFFAIAEPI